jgi:hypothetical protein
MSVVLCCMDGDHTRVLVYDSLQFIRKKYPVTGCNA